jgi:nicotinamidase-related amidase
LTVATLFVDWQVDFFSSHPQLIQNRSQLITNVNGLATISRRSGSYIFWIKQVFAADLHDAPDVVRLGSMGESSGMGFSLKIAHLLIVAAQE